MNNLAAQNTSLDALNVAKGFAVPAPEFWSERRILAGFFVISALAGILLAVFTLISSNVPGD